MRKPAFSNLLKVLGKQKPDRPTLFELFMNDPLYERLAGRPLPAGAPANEQLRLKVEAFTAAGYDYATTHASDFTIGRGEGVPEQRRRNTRSLNEGYSITDRASFERFQWNDPDSFDDSRLEAAKEFLPEGMKLMVMGPCGVLENVISIVGFDNLCMMLYDDPALAQAIFDQVGARLLKYYASAVEHETVGLLCSNDDWGFNTQTFLSPADMRRYVFPWHQKIVDLAHRHGKPCILHSCGYFMDMIDPVIDELHFDGKHSYEDNILPVEDCYERWNPRIAVLGGLDMDFLIQSPPDAIRQRARAMLERTMDRGGYALGTGNSVPAYLPPEHYLAMISVVHEYD